jgi:hypothetical protein
MLNTILLQAKAVMSLIKDIFAVNKSKSVSVAAFSVVTVSFFVWAYFYFTTKPLDAAKVGIKEQFLVEIYDKPTRERYFCVIRIYYDEQQGIIKCEGMNYNILGKVTYGWNTDSSEFVGNELRYQYSRFPKRLNNSNCGRGSLNFFGPTKTVVGGEFADEHSQSISFSTIELDVLLPKYNFNYNLLADWTHLGLALKPEIDRLLKEKTDSTGKIKSEIDLVAK